jgi:ribosome-interacting GTPase 1
MNKDYSVTITYEAGRKKGQMITIDRIDPDDIMEILGEITQEQLANAEITIEGEQSMLSYEDFIIARYTYPLTNNAKKS